MNNLDRIDKIDAIFTIDVSSGDVEISSNPTSDDRFPCRAIWSDYGGIVKFDVKSHEDGRTRVVIVELPAMSWVQIGNIVKVYRYYTGSTETSSQVFKDDGTLTLGVKLGR